MEVYTCDSVSYVICRNLAFLMLDLVTSGILYSALIKRTLFSFAKVVFLSLITKVIPLKNRENQISSHYCTFAAHLAAESPKHCPFLIPCRPLFIFKPACWRSGLLAGLPVCLLAGRQASRMAGWTAGRLERGQACRPAYVCSHVFSFMQTHIQSGLQAFMRI